MIKILKEQIDHIEEIEILDELKNRRDISLKNSLSSTDSQFGLVQQVQYLFYSNLVNNFEKYLRNKEV